MAPEPVDNHNQNTYNESNLQSALNVITLGSSSEEDEALILDNGGYQPLPQSLDNLDIEEQIDYSSLSGLMTALNTHGATNVQDTEADKDTEGVDKSCLEAERLETPLQLSQTSQKVINFTKRGKEEEYLKEQACLWNSKTGSNEIILDEDKETEIKRVMSRIRLPNTAIPSWAKEISDDEWKSQILSVFGSNLSEKN
ncbi:hypothetical protein Anas_08338 [Armadillidium nasatum]|uniref:Male-enhanced antigen 1 n=1 Tax=Armadillidium nasatum TaxID=96803 RepID=A0A5N5TDK5_9CRUS|nr:hypothetical protein Anas_08338 [Armadillidium nasatum]